MAKTESSTKLNNKTTLRFYLFHRTYTYIIIIVVVVVVVIIIIIIIISIVMWEYYLWFWKHNFHLHRHQAHPQKVMYLSVWLLLVSVCDNLRGNGACSGWILHWTSCGRHVHERIITECRTEFFTERTVAYTFMNDLSLNVLWRIRSWTMTHWTYCGVYVYERSLTELNLPSRPVK